MKLSDKNLRLNEIIDDTYFFIYRVGGFFGSSEQVIHLQIDRNDIEQLLKYKGYKMIKTTTEHTKKILEDQRDSIEAKLMIKNDLMQRVYNKDLPFSFIDDTGLSLYGFDVKNKYEVISFDYEKDCFRCATTCGLTNKRRKAEAASEL